MFTIPVSDILSSYTGDSKEFSFSWAIYDGYFEDITFQKDLSFDLKIIGLDDSVEVVFKNLETDVTYEWVPHHITIWGFERTFSEKYDPEEAIAWVHMIKGGNIDLAPVLREEIIMACHEL